MQNKTIFFFLTLLLFLSSCKRKEEKTDAGYDYFPLIKGNYIVYNVQKLTYSTLDTLRENFQIKEVVADTFTINGEQRFRIERFKRNTDSDPWPSQPDSVWSAVRTVLKAIRVEDNTRLIKMAFPVSKGKSWNGNGENSYGEDEFEYASTGSPFEVNGKSFSNTVSIMQSPNDSNFVQKDYRMEVYAKDVGLIYKVKEQYSYNQQYYGFYKIGAGIRYYERILSYGHQ